MFVLFKMMDDWHLDEKLRKLGLSRSQIEILLDLYSRSDDSATLREIQSHWAYRGEYGEKELLGIIREMSDVECDGDVSPEHWGETRLVLKADSKKYLDELVQPLLEKECLSPSNWRREVLDRALKGLADSLRKEKSERER